jgi:hypothetical protein
MLYVVVIIKFLSRVMLANVMNLDPDMESGILSRIRIYILNTKISVASHCSFWCSHSRSRNAMQLRVRIHLPTAPDLKTFCALCSIMHNHDYALCLTVNNEHISAKFETAFKTILGHESEA